MSRVGQKPLEIPKGVTIQVEGPKVDVKGPLGSLTATMPGSISAAVEAGRLTVRRADETTATRSLHGLTRTLIANMVAGVTAGFSRMLMIEGVGFKAALDGKTLVLALGFSSPKRWTIPEGIKVTVDAGTNIAVQGLDKQKVGDAAARIRAFFPAEPYKGKGIRYRDERVRRKVGKTVA
jgi:large subunit ribosomal protein L6